MFVCLASTAVHREVSHVIDTYSFSIGTLENNCQKSECDTELIAGNGSNLLGAKNELKRALQELDNKKNFQFFQCKGVD